MSKQAVVDNGEDDVREMMTAEEVLSRVPISRTTLFRLEKEGLFPQGQLLTPHRKLWFRDEIVQWQKDLQDPDSDLAKLVKLRAVKTK